MRWILLILFFTSSTFALKFQTKINLSGERKNIISCSEKSDHICQGICGATSCEYIEPICYNCISTDQASLEYILLALESFTLGERVHEGDIIESIYLKKSIWISPQFIFNTSRWFAPSLRLRFQNLCKNSPDYNNQFPTIFTTLNQNSNFDLQQNLNIYCPSTDNNLYFYPLTQK